MAEAAEGADGSLNLTGYLLCILDGPCQSIRGRNLFLCRSLRDSDSRRGLLPGAVWVAVRAVICRTVGVSAPAMKEPSGSRNGPSLRTARLPNARR